MTRIEASRHAANFELVRFPLLMLAAIVIAVALWLLVRVVFNPLDAKPGG
jgi:hypothetical protein